MLVSRKDIEQQLIASISSQTVDMSAPTLEVEVDDCSISGVLVGGGSGVNIMTYETMKKLGLSQLETIPFVIRLANQSRIKPIGILKNVRTSVARL